MIDKLAKSTVGTVLESFEIGSAVATAINPELAPVAAVAVVGNGLYKLGENFNLW